MKRDFNTPEYKAWRDAVYRRDGYKCKMPGCKTKSKKLNAHHIRRWADAPSLRYAVSNGITLCYNHHKQCEAREEDFEELFLNIINSKSKAYLSIIVLRTKRSEVDDAEEE